MDHTKNFVRGNEIAVKTLVLGSIIAVALATFFVAGMVLAQETAAPPPEVGAPAPEAPAAPPPEATAPLPAPEAPAPPPAPVAVPPPPSAEVMEAVNKDVDIKPEDLGVSKPTILPDSPLYFAKNIWRGVQSLVTIDPVKEAELKLKFANEKIMETKELAEKTDNPEVLKDGLENYQAELGKVKEQVDKIKDMAADNQKVDQFVEKFVGDNIKQQKLMDKLGEKLSGEAFDKVQEVKEEIAAKFADVTLKMATPEEVTEKINKVVEEQAGSDLKQFKNLEVLQRVERQVPEAAKEAIRSAQENAMKRLKETLEQDKGAREMFKDYVKNVPGNEAQQLGVVQDFEARMIPPQIRDVMEGAKTEATKRIQQRIMGFKQKEHQERFFKHLEGGEMEDLRIIRELEANLPSDAVSKILDIKNKAFGNFKKEMAASENPEDFFQKMGEFRDVKQLSVLKEIEKVIPENKKAFFEEIKTKTKAEMEQKFSQAGGEMEKRMMIEQMAGGEDPDDMAIIQEFGPPPQMLNEILKEQALRLSEKIQTTEDAERLQILKQRIDEEESVKSALEQRHPEIFKKIEMKEEVMFGKMDKEKAEKQISAAQEEINLAESEIAASSHQDILNKFTPASRILSQAKNKLAKAQAAIAENNFGMAFGNATAALHMANEVRKIVKEVALREEIMPKPPEGMPPGMPPGGAPGVPPEGMGSCSWCGDNCVKVDIENPPICPTVMPPQGYVCVQEDGGCAAKQIGEGRMPPPEGAPGMPPIGEKPEYCLMVLTPARNQSTGACNTFGSSCLPPGWVKDDSCRGEGGEGPVPPGEIKPPTAPPEGIRLPFIPPEGTKTPSVPPEEGFIPRIFDKFFGGGQGEGQQIYPEPEMQQPEMRQPEGMPSPEYAPPSMPAPSYPGPTAPPAETAPMSPPTSLLKIILPIIGLFQ